MVPFLVENVFKLRVNQKILCVLSLWCCTAESLVFGYWRTDGGFFGSLLKLKSVTVT